jgi:hypothetical protein
MCKATHAFHLKKENELLAFNNRNFVWGEISTSNIPYQRHIIKNNKAIETKPTGHWMELFLFSFLCVGVCVIA